jgi:2-polyprenyl-6-methoxyphenol hydroxylase-like FAD-dependent oxidoreductase
LGGVVRHVVVIGNSFAGLLTAHVLAGRAEKVTILDRDRIPDAPQARGGVPQGRHIHVVITAGQHALEELLPGILAELQERAVPELGLPRDVVNMLGGRWIRRTTEPTSILTGTRPLVEHVVRRRVLSNQRVEARDATEVVGLVGDRHAISGVLVRHRDGTQATEELEADLVVDASGRSSKMPQWLMALGVDPPREERIDAGVAYATRVYRSDEPTDYRGIYLIASPEAPRGGAIMPIEEPGLYLVGLAGLAGDEPPNDPDGFEEYASGLPHTIMRDWIGRAQAQGPVMSFRQTANVRRHYDRLGGRPAGLLVVGDASCAFNPVYGQGITVAALGARAIRDALAAGNRSLAEWQRLIARSAADAWATRTLPEKIAGWYLARVEAHAAANPVVGRPFRQVLHLVSPASVLFGWPVLRTVLFGRVQPPATEPPLRPESEAVTSAER